MQTIYFLKAHHAGNQHRPALTQYHRLPANTAFYWPSIQWFDGLDHVNHIFSESISVPPSTNQYLKEYQLAYLCSSNWLNINAHEGSSLTKATCHFLLINRAFVINLLCRYAGTRTFHNITFHSQYPSPISKHLKGQLDPPVGNDNVFGPKEVSWIPLLVTATFFGPKEVSWIPLLVTVTFFGPKEVSWIPPWVTSHFLDQRRLVFMVFDVVSMIFG